MDRRVTPPKAVTSLTWGTPPPCKQALTHGSSKGKKVSMFISEDDERNGCSSQAKAKRKGISRTQMALAVEHRYRTLRLCGKRIPFHLCHLETSPKRYAQSESWTLFPDFKSSAPTNQSQRIMTFQATNLVAVKGFASL